MRQPMKSLAAMSEDEWERVFPDEESCIEWLVTSRWHGNKYCPRCGSDLVFPASLREYRWRCFGCVPDLGHCFDYLTGTIFEGRGVPLRVWLKALHHELIGRAHEYAAGERKLRRLIRKAMRAAEFRRMISEQALVQPRVMVQDKAQSLSDAQETSCPEPESPPASER